MLLVKFIKHNQNYYLKLVNFQPDKSTQQQANADYHLYSTCLMTQITRNFCTKYGTLN